MTKLFNCIRCFDNKPKGAFPSNDNPLTCGGCLSELAAMHREAEKAKLPRGM